MRPFLFFMLGLFISMVFHLALPWIVEGVFYSARIANVYFADENPCFTEEGC